MKLFNTTSYPGGFYLDILKLRKYSLISFSYERKVYFDLFPSLMIQLGGDSLLIVSLEIFNRIYTLTLIDKHYDN